MRQGHRNGRQEGQLAAKKLKKSAGPIEMTEKSRLAKGRPKTPTDGPSGMNGDVHQCSVVDLSCHPHFADQLAAWSWQQWPAENAAFDLNRCPHLPLDSRWCAVLKTCTRTFSTITYIRGRIGSHARLSPWAHWCVPLCPPSRRQGELIGTVSVDTEDMVSRSEQPWVS